jgi:hypothetical protein
VLGNEEPVILLAEGEARNTSLAAEPQPKGDCYHVTCYLEAQRRMGGPAPGASG